MLGIFALKIVAALALHVIYTYYYTDRSTADVFKYFDDAQQLFASLHENPMHFFQILFSKSPENAAHLQSYFEYTFHWDRPTELGLPNDNQTLIRINMLLMLFSWGNVFVHHIVAAFASFVAFCLIYKVFITHFPQQKTVLILGIFLVPSSLFWASAMLKECVVMIGLGLFVYGFHLFLQKNRWRWLIPFMLGLFTLLCIKIYILAALIPASIALLLSVKFPRIRPWKIYGMVFAAVAIIVSLNELLHGIPLLDALANKRALFIAQAVEQQAGSYIAIGNIDSSLWTFIKETPFALWRAFALPYAWNIRSVMDVLPAFESFTCIVLIILACIFPKRHSESQRSILLFAFTFSLVLLWITGITTPTIGGIVRYRMPMLPFAITAIALCVDWHLLGKTLCRLRFAKK